jgi:predicted secreted protein
VLTSLTVTGTRVLGLGESVQTDRTKLVMQTDGNLAIVDQSGTTRWKSDTAGTGTKAVFQDDGNFVVYDSQTKTAWSSRTEAHNGAVLVLQSNGDVCIVYQGTSIWCAGTAH